MQWFERLNSEDLGFLKRFLLASGSLKAMADQYGISYPTVRLRLDRLIAKVEIFDSQVQMSEFERQLRAYYADGKLDQATFELLLSSHRKEIQSTLEGKNDDSSHVT